MNHFFRLLPLICFCLMVCSETLWADVVQENEKVVLQFKWLHSFQFAGYYAAKEQGFYRQEHLDVELRESVEGSSSVEQVLKGDAQYGVADTALLQERLNGKPVVVLAAIFQHNPLVLVTLKKSGILSPYELSGKRVMNAPNNDAPLLAMYYETNVDPNKIVQVENTFDLNDLINGKVDALSAYLTDQINDLKQQGVEFNIIDPRNYGVDFLGDNLFTTEQEITRHPERVERFLRASLKGWDYALKHPEEIIQLILKKYNSRQRLTESHLRFEAVETAKMILPESIPLGSADIKRFQRIAETYQHLGLVRSTERLQGFIYRQALDHKKDFTPAERAWLDAHPVLRVGVQANFAPFEWLDAKDQYVGLSADYMALIADYLNVKIEVVVNNDWSEVLSQIKKGTIDMLADVTQTPERRQYLSFSEPYSNYPVVIIDNGQGAYVRDLQQLSGKDVVIESGSFIEELLKRDHPDLHLVLASNVLDALKKLNNGLADAYVGDAVSANYVIKKEGLLSLRFTGETDYRKITSLATSKHNPELLSLLNKALADISLAEHNRIQNRWLSLQAEQQTISLDTAFKYGALFLLFVIFIVHWNLRLRQAIHKSRQLEIELRQNQAKLHAIIHACPVPLVLYDEQQRIIFINLQFIKCFGYTLEDIPTFADWWEKAFPDPEYRQWVSDVWLEATIKSKNEQTPLEPLELNVCCKDGSIRTVVGTATPLGDRFEETYLFILYDVTTRKQAERALQESLNLLQAVINNAPIRIFWKDVESHYLGCNDAFAKDSGFISAEQVVGKDDYEMIHQDNADRYRADDQAVMSTGTAKLNFEYRQRISDGSIQWRRTSKVPLCNETDQVIGVLGIYEDITESKQVAESLHLAASVFANTQEGIVITDVEGNIVDANRAFIEITGYTREEILGKNPNMFQSGRHDANFYMDMWRAIRQKRYWCGEVSNRRKNGEVYTEWLTISAITDTQNELIGYIGTSSDISLLKQRERQLEQMIHYDTLTGLPNRVLLTDCMNLAIAQCKRNNCFMAVCYLDLDGFTAVNERFGHEMGDRLLIEITQRIKQTLREEDTISRLGGDEFAFILQDLERIEDCEHTLNRLLKAINIPSILQDQSVEISASIGISIYPEDNNSPDTLLRHASQAMYQTKQQGKNAFHIYNIELDKQLHAHRNALNRIEHAFENGEFELYFQPKVDMKKGIVFGAEALIRWNHPERGLVLPTEFLPLMENNEYANRLDDWVIDRALQHIVEWQTLGLALKVSINVSARSIQSANFVSKLRAAFDHHPVANRHHFELEILETEVLNDLGKTAQIIRNCQVMGVGFSLDDFGTGYSSLSYLRRLPVQTLKIDRSFVRDMLEDENDLAIVRSVIGLADSFKRQVIAEGVESLEHGVLLMDMGCYLAQGYAISKPMPAAEFLNWLQFWKMPIEWQQSSSV